MLSYEGKKTRLRPVRRSDKEKSIVWRNTPQIFRDTLGYRLPITDEMEGKWFDEILDGQGKSTVVFAIEEIRGDTLIGFIFLNNIDWISRRCHFGVLIGEREFQGRGMAKDSMVILFSYAFDLLNLKKICLEVCEINASAISLYRDFGFVEEGVLVKHNYWENDYHNVILMRIFDCEFRKKYNIT